MGFALEDWILYTMWAAFGLMIIDFLIVFIKSLWNGSFSPSIVLDYLQGVLFYVFPLSVLISMFGIDPSGWILIAFYFIGGLGVSLKYLMDIISRFK